MTYPTVTVDIAFATAPFATPTWTTLSARDIRLGWGRNQTTEGYRPGKGTITLDNDNREFDPAHTGGTYYGQLLPRRRVRVRANWNSTDYTVFEGFVDRDGFPQQIAQVTNVGIEDGLVWLSEQELVDVYAAELAADAADMVGWWRLGERQGQVAADELGGNDASLSDDASAFTTTGIVEGSPLPAMAVPSGDRLTIPREATPSGTEWTFEMWVSIPPGATGSHILVSGELTISLSSAFGLVVSANGGAVATAFKLTARNRPYHLVVYRDGTDIGVYADGTFLADDNGASGSTSQKTMTVGGFAATPETVAEIAVYDAWIGSSRVAAHHTAGRSALDGQTTNERVEAILDQVGWPAADRTIDTGKTAGVLGPANLAGRKALDALRAVERTEAGALYIDHHDDGNLRFRQRHAGLLDTNMTVSQATWSDEDTGGVHHYTALEVVDQPIYNDVTVAWDGGEVTVEDSTSVTAHTRRTLRVDTLLATSVEAQSLAEWLLAQYKDRKAIIRSVEFRPSGNHSLFAECLGREVGDRVTVRRHPQQVGSAIAEDYLVVGVDHQIRNGVNEWVTTFTLDPVEDATTYWVWGTGTWDTGTVWAY